jgi:tetratricopeptide (TPR) repeat protein
MGETELIIALILAIICAIPAGIFIEGVKDYQKNKKYYDLIWKRSTSLKPRDLLGLRQYNPYYYQRGEDVQIKGLLRNGENILLVGSPLAGKTRTVFESLTDTDRTYDVIKPKPVEISPDSLHIPKHFRWWNPRLVVFDDVHEFASKGNFAHMLATFHENNVPIVATCRSGLEFEKLEKVIDVSQYFKGNVINVGSIDDRTGKTIAADNGIRWNDIKFNHTIGSIFVPLKTMEYRFSHEIDEKEKRILRTLKKLHITGLYNEKMIFPLNWLKILSKCYELTLDGIEWNSHLVNLLKLGFIETKYKGEKIKEVQVEEVYLDYIIKFEGDPRDDIEIFREVLPFFQMEKDHQALIKIGLSAHEKGLIKEKRDFMQIALDAYTTCLKINNFSENKTDYAFLLHSLGKTYCSIATTKEDPKPDLEKSIEFLNKAIEIRTRKKHLLDYAETQNMLGNSYANLAKIDNRKENLEKAIRCYEEALKIKAINSYPVDYADAANNISTAYLELSEEGNTKENLEKAIKYCRESLLVRTKDKYPLEYASTINNLANAYNRLAEKSEGSKSDLEQAIKYYQETLEIKTIEKYPIHYAVSQNNLGVAYSNLGKLDPKKEHLYKAIEHIGEALRVREKDKYPFDYASSKYNLGTAYMNLAALEDKKSNCSKAKQCYDEALEIMTKNKYPVIYDMISENIKELHSICGNRVNNPNI